MLSIAFAQQLAMQCPLIPPVTDHVCFNVITINTNQEKKVFTSDMSETREYVNSICLYKTSPIGVIYIGNAFVIYLMPYVWQL